MIEFNRENYLKVLEKIKSDPACWNQQKWHCGTQHCFAGWAQILAGKEADDRSVRRDARIFLGLTIHEGQYLFAPARTIEDFENFVNTNFDSDGYDRDGYDKDGLNENNQPRAE